MPPLSVAAHPPSLSPFLESKNDELPKLRKISTPLPAIVELQQQLSFEAVDLPTGKIRESKRMYAARPASSCPPDFRFLFNAFCTARIATTPRTLDEAEAIVSSQTMELLAWAKGEVAEQNSLPPRSVCISLVIPVDSVNNANNVSFVDGFAALSDLKIDGVPIATKVRFDIFAGMNAIPVAKTLRFGAKDKGFFEGISLVVRWSELVDGVHGVRIERFSLGSTCPDINSVSTHLQSVVVRMSTVYGFKLPPEFFFAPLTSTERYYEKQICDCSREWQNILHTEEPFEPSEQMLKTNTNALFRVPGTYVRQSSIAMQEAGVTLPDVTHALLLCGEGKEQAALEYAKKYREGLKPPEGQDEELDLHTVALYVSKVFLNGMVSLYAHGGKAGKAIRASGNWVYKTTAAVVSVNKLSSTFYVMSCGMESVVPDRLELAKFMDTHMKKATDVFGRLFERGDADVKSADVSSCPLILQSEVHKMSEDEKFLLSAMGLDIKSQRMLVGEAIAFLSQTGGPTSLIEMLTNTGLRVGLTRTLSEVFHHCSELAKEDTKKDELHSEDVRRLKRIAEAALLLGATKKICRGVGNTKPEKVRALMQVFSLEAGRGTNVAKLSDVLTVPRDDHVTHRLATVIYTAYHRSKEIQTMEKPHIEELKVVLKSYVDILAALGKCLYLCMVEPGEKKDAFVAVHGGSAGVSLFQVLDGGLLELCGEGRVFESQEPCLMILKMKSDTDCIVTPMVVVRP